MIGRLWTPKGGSAVIGGRLDPEGVGYFSPGHRPGSGGGLVFQAEGLGYRAIAALQAAKHMTPVPRAVPGAKVSDPFGV